MWTLGSESGVTLCRALKTPAFVPVEILIRPLKLHVFLHASHSAELLVNVFFCAIHGVRLGKLGVELESVSSSAQISQPSGQNQTS